jgi:class 3 adenylate cyclase
VLAQFEEIEQFARECFRKANEATDAIQFSLNERYTKSASGTLRAEAPYHIGHTPRFIDLDTSRGVGGWAVVLSVDLRGSSKRADEIGPEDTYLTMHTYLPTMAELVSKSDGHVGSLRGDGLFAVFGFTEYEPGRKTPVPQEVGETAISNATKCGKAMIEATADILNPVLEENGVLGELRVGVGICVGDVVVTQIGVGDAFERTLYGTPVNNACKACKHCTNEMILTNQAEAIYPTSDGGKIRFKPINLGGSLGGKMFIPHDGFVMLPRRRAG